MGYRKVNDESLIAIADAIRNVTETTDTLTFPEDFVSGIQNSQQLNFKIVGGITRPESPSENTIWVNTDTEITDWCFCAETPSEPTDGMIWFSTGRYCTAPFNAVSKGSITVYPTGCSQYIGSEWIYKDAEIYQNGAWTEWTTERYLYKLGDENTSFTGGWISEGIQSKSTYTSKAPSLSKGTSSMSMSMNTGDTPSSGIVKASNTIDFTDYNTLYIDMTGTVTQYNTVAVVIYTDGTTVLDYSGNAFTNTSKVPASHIFFGTQTISRDTYAIDVTGLTGEYAVGILLHYQSNKGTISATIYNVWVDK